MPNSWFRLYNEALDDPKVQSLPDRLFKFWINILCLASRKQGYIMSSNVAFSLRIDANDAKNDVAELERLTLLDRVDDEHLIPHNWLERQFVSDTSTERVKRFRNASMKRFKHVSRNAPEQNRTEQNPVVPCGDFERFWEAYPKKVGKLAAQKAWDRAKRPDIAQILVAVRTAKASPQWTRDGGQYIPNPATWLNQGRWDDNPLIPPSPDAAYVPKPFKAVC